MPEKKSLLFVSSIRLPEESNPTARKKWSGLADRFRVYVIGFSSGGFVRKSLFNCKFYGVPGNLWFPLRAGLYYLLTPLLTAYLTLRYNCRYWTAQGPYEGLSVWMVKYFLKPFKDPRLIIEAHGDWIQSFVTIRTVPFKPFIEKLLRWISPLLLYPADAFRSVSDETESMLESFNAYSRPHRNFPGFTDLELFLETSYPEKEDLEKPRVLYVGALTELKGIPDLLKATKTLRDEAPDVQLRLCGEGNRERYQRTSSELGLTKSVEFLGEIPQTELVEEYLSCRLLVLPSYTEGLPRVLLEGLACYTPFVATKTPGSKQIQQESGAGRIVPRGDPPRLASAMLDLFFADKKRREMGKRGRQYTENQYSVEQFFDGYERLVNDINPVE
ncbi:MAG: glycosyltransferase family 4 protein [bacterium]